MRYRDYKIFRAGSYYHIYNRGNNKQVIFKDASDYFNFLKRIRLALGSTTDESKLNLKPVPPGSFAVVSYCLMPNHFHFLIRQNLDTGIEKFISKICTSYVAYFNKKYNHVGHLFQDAFKAKLIENDSYMVYLSAYIHNNPDDPLNYCYSSLPDIAGSRADKICSRGVILGFFENCPEMYKKFILRYNKEIEDSIRHLVFED